MEEISIKVNQTPALISANFEEIKEELASITKAYEGLCYTDDTMSSAKSDVATLRKIKNAIDEKRKEVKKENAIPFEEFEKGCKELIKMIDDVINPIDKQIKTYQEEKKLKKKEEIVKMWDSLNPDEWILLAEVFKESWFNASKSLKSIKEEMMEHISSKRMDVKTIMATESKYAEQGAEFYKRTGDIAGAIRKIMELEEQERRIKEEIKQEEIKQEEKAVVISEEASIDIQGFDVDDEVQGFNVYVEKQCIIKIESEHQENLVKEFLIKNNIKHNWR